MGGSLSFGDAVVRDGSQQMGDRSFWDGAILRRLKRISRTVNSRSIEDEWAMEVCDRDGTEVGSFYSFEAWSVSGDSVQRPLEFGG